MMHTGLLTFLLFLASCLPAETNRELVRDGGSATTTTGTVGGGTSVPTDIGWFQNFVSVKRISFYRNQLDNLYLQGTPINNYLIRVNNPTASYCIEMDMGESIPVTDKRFLRVRAVPVSVNATTGKARYLRVDFNNPTAGSEVCKKDKVQFVTDSTTEFIPYTGTGVTFNLSEICASCVTTVTSIKMKLFAVEATRLAQISPREIDLSTLLVDLRVGSAGGETNSCSTASCSALGFHCCLDNQCVKNGQVKNGVDQSTPEFLAARADTNSNPMAYIRYPQFFYICGTIPPTGGTTSGTSTGGTSQDDILRQQADYKCIQHLKAKSSITPYLQSPYTPEVTDQNVCNTTVSTSPIFVTTVLTRLFDRCASNCKGADLNERIANCPFKPDYNGINFNTAGVPAGLECTLLPDAGSTTTGQNGGQVNVSSRSMPHRFFSTSGTEFDFSSAPPAGTVQEGTRFSYNDVEKVSPNNGTFNMNSILGQFAIELDQAKPATVVNVEIDQVYTINTQDGVYSTECLECNRDAWYLRYKPYPTTQRGRGLVGNNYTTRRDADDGNPGLGNFEDTLFGRACWVPPTMLPFSQPVGEPVATQREIRLKTQAAMWVNGYRRDWFGFNKGALIGSFDGVSWFAIGKGRIIRSTSNKLFLAINAPFGDLTSNSIHSVTVNTFTAGNGAQVDFNPALDLNHPDQNDAATCQASHQCSVDRDCITRLGWEYVCADVLQQSTQWPGFTPTGAREEPTVAGTLAGGIINILAQDSLPNPEGGSSKRCVYRGAGAVCRTDAGAIPDTDLEKRKLLTCAPNFWCADVDGTNNVVPGSGSSVRVFNKEIARFNRPVDELPVTRNHRFGQDTNVLGRPLDYVHSTSGTNSLIRITDGQVITTLNANVSSMDPAALNKVGLCRPGKQLPYLDGTSTVRAWNPYDQHQALDDFSRTDFISQIASCPASFQSIYKATSCPVLDADGNYLHLTTANSTITGASYAAASLAQNSCGLETLRTLTAPTTLANYPTADAQQLLSPFASIESKPLNATTVMDRTLVRDACLRKAGAVCHTDLDCSPNRMHAGQVENFNDSFFGNVPNRRYYEEFLVCGQETAKPAVGSDEYKDFDPTLNRCCREVGSSLSTYSANEPSGTASGPTGDTAETVTLDPFTTGAEFPTDPSRYERFASLVDPSSSLTALNAFDDRTAGGNLNSVFFGSSTASANIRTPLQWQTLNNANANTCCGGGWMRKFSDGTTAWPIAKRMNVNVESFRCLNYISPLVGTTDPGQWGLSQAELDADFGRYCTDVLGNTGNCAQLQIQIENNLADSLVCATRNAGAYGAVTSNFSTLPGEVAYSSNIFSFFPPSTADDDVATFVDFSNGSGRRNITIAMPSYVGASAISVFLQRRDPSNVASEIPCTLGGTGLTSASPATSPGTCASGCCYDYSGRVLRVSFPQGGASGRYGARVSFTPPGTAGSPGPQGKIACKDYYYLDLLGRLELSGIPQITYPRMLCNTNGNRVVPGLFKIADTDNNRAAFNDVNFSFNDPVNAPDRVTNYQGLETGQVFDPHEFKCCTPLGRLTKNGATCCSGLGVEFEDPSLPPTTTPNFKCMLPPGTDLNVYFNRFVSNEATNPDLPNDISFAVSDFNAQTGELNINTANNSKLAAIGNELCNSSGAARVCRGSAFGNFRPQPLSATNGTQTNYGIVDSSDDTTTVSSCGNNVTDGFQAFNANYRWNHHTYCK